MHTWNLKLSRRVQMGAASNRKAKASKRA